MSAPITLISVPTPFKVGAVNCYLIEGEPLTLVDTGPNDADSVAALDEGLRASGRRVEDLELIVLTHQHYDHLGLVRELTERSGAEVAAHELLAEFVADFDAAMEADDEYAAAIMELHGVDRESSDYLRALSRENRRYGSSVAVDRAMRDGDLLDLGSIALEVSLRPGHSPTDTIFLARRERVALVGDHLIARISSNPVVHRPLAGPVDPRRRPSALAEYLTSLQRTAGDEIEQALSGHGPVVTDHRRLIDERLLLHEGRKQQLARALERGPATAAELVGVLWPGLAADQTFLGLSEVLGHLDLLVADGRVLERERGAVVEFAAVAEAPSS